MNKVIYLFTLLIITLFFVGPASTQSDNPHLGETCDPRLQKALITHLDSLHLNNATERKRLSVVVVDITDTSSPRMAYVNPNEMMYAASLPKIAILLGAFEKIANGEMPLDDEILEKLKLMIRNSSNAAATEILHRVGMEYLAELLQSPRYRLYDPGKNGGLWVGRDYSGGSVWKRDPLHNISHGTTAMQAARFYYLAVTGRLVSEQFFNDFAEIMSNPGIQHKFVKGIKKSNPDAEIYRKSGTWKNFHADSGVIVDKEKGYQYIIVALVEHPKGADGLARFAGVVDETMDSLQKASK